MDISDIVPYANSADPDQTAPEEEVWSGLSQFAIPFSILHKKQNLNQKSME